MKWGSEESKEMGGHGGWCGVEGMGESRGLVVNLGPGLLVCGLSVEGHGESRIKFAGKQSAGSTVK